MRLERRSQHGALCGHGRLGWVQDTAQDMSRPVAHEVEYIPAIGRGQRRASRVGRGRWALRGIAVPHARSYGGRRCHVDLVRLDVDVPVPALRNRTSSSALQCIVRLLERTAHVLRRSRMHEEKACTARAADDARNPQHLDGTDGLLRQKDRVAQLGAAGPRRLPPMLGAGPS